MLKLVITLETINHIRYHFEAPTAPVINYGSVTQLLRQVDTVADVSVGGGGLSVYFNYRTVTRNGPAEATQAVVEEIVSTLTDRPFEVERRRGVLLPEH